MFFNTNTFNSSNENLDLASIVSINTVNAEDSAKKKLCYPGGTGCDTDPVCHKTTQNFTCSGG